MSAGIVLLAALIAAPDANVVRGIVRGAEGQPVERAEVWLFDQSYMLPGGMPPAHVITTADGRFALPLPANAPFGRNYAYEVFAYKPGAGMSVALIDLRPLPAAALTMDLQASVPLKLLIVDPDGKPLPDTSVKVLNFSDVSLRCNCWLPTSDTPEPFAQRTNARGEVTFDFCKPIRSVSLVVESRGYGRQILGRLEDGTNKPLQLAHAGKLRGRLVCADQQLAAGAVVWINSISKPPGDAMGTANVLTDMEGRFEVPAIAAGDVRVQYVKHSHGSPIFLEKEVTSTLAAGETVEINVPVIRGVRIFGKVVDADNEKPLPAVPAHISLNRGGFGKASWSVLTDKDGRYEVYVPPGAGRGFVQFGPLSTPYLPAYDDREADEFPAEGDELEMPDFFVKRGITLTGTVVDTEQRPISLARVQATAVDHNKFHYHRVVAETDKNGKFSIGPIDDDLVVVLMAADETRASAEVLPIIPGKPQTGIVLSIVASAMAELSGRLIDADGEPIADALVDAGSDMGSANWEWYAMIALQPISPFRARTDKNGKYVFTNRFPRLGRYYIQANCPGYVAKRLPLVGSEIPPGKQVLEDLVLEREKRK